MPELTTSQRAWRRQAGNVSLPEVHRSIVVPVTASFWRKLLAFSGPGFLVAVGYMDPGNWATDLAGGARFGYALLLVVMISNFMAILLQHLCIKLGVATGRDLAQACRDHYSTPDGLVSLDSLRNRHRRVRSGRSRRLSHRAYNFSSAFRWSGVAALPRSMCWPCFIFRTKVSVISRRWSSR